MSYVRVIPRDLFNEANLLKCFGQIYINLESLNLPKVRLEHDGKAFRVAQDASSGALYLGNVTLVVGESYCQLHRPLNSREAWPLMLTTAEEEEISVFDVEGNFSPEMVEFLKQGS